MPDLDHTWILAANASRARAWATEPDLEELHLVHELHHAESRAHGHELVTDRPGSQQAPHARAARSGTPGAHGAQGQRSGVGPTTAPKEVEKEVFAREVAEWLNTAARRDGFERLVLICSPQLLGLVRGRLAPAVQERLAFSLDKDYTDLAPDALVERIRENLPGGRGPGHDPTPRSGLRSDVPAWAQRGNQQPAG